MKENEMALLEELSMKYDKLYCDMGKMANLVVEIYNKLMNGNQGSASSTDADYNSWKDSVYKKSKILIDRGLFDSYRECLSSIYDKMTRVYGVCWDQERIDFHNQFGDTSRAYKMNIVWNKDMLRSIFDSIMDGLVGDYPDCGELTEKSKKNLYGSCDDIIRPLIQKNEDSSRYGCATFHRVYTHMNHDGKVDWERAEHRYINKYGNRGMTRKLVIESSPTLMKKFKASVDALMTEQ